MDRHELRILFWLLLQLLVAQRGSFLTRRGLEEKHGASIAARRVLLACHPALSRAASHQRGRVGHSGGNAETLYVIGQDQRSDTIRAAMRQLSLANCWFDR